MQLVVLAGGLGTRLGTVASNVPKALVPVAGRPFVEHQLELFRLHNLDQILFCTGHLGEMIERHVGDGSKFGVSAMYSREAPESLLGTAGALVNALPQLAEEFLVIYGDSYLPTDLRAFVEWSRLSGSPAAMTVFHNAGQWDKSNVRVAGRKVVFYSKDAPVGECDFIDYGLSYFKRAVIESYFGSPLPLDLGFVHRQLVAKGLLDAFEVSERFYEVGTPKGVDELGKYLAERRL
jgi:MurNAc alpha-1-phosphate uridylyltransferase